MYVCMYCCHKLQVRFKNAVVLLTYVPYARDRDIYTTTSLDFFFLVYIGYIGLMPMLDSRKVLVKELVFNSYRKEAEGENPSTRKRRLESRHKLLKLSAGKIRSQKSRKTSHCRERLSSTSLCWLPQEVQDLLQVNLPLVYIQYSVVIYWPKQDAPP